MDRGIPTEEALAEMRASDPPVSYIVFTPKGRLSKLGAELCELPWEQVREGIEIKLLPRGGELYVFAKATAPQGRVPDEPAMAATAHGTSMMARPLVAPARLSGKLPTTMIWSPGSARPACLARVVEYSSSPLVVRSWSSRQIARPMIPW